ncbi:MAG: hypothetical protein KKB81_00070 [Candidatus Margulisbacteria bacterium]|nr:hypothetical protein [Candidatus Margulisiibacteriota bacterium]MBU1022350.1 hypothetical protein [Candidatus Margulisiibacteriota bacterium]MBU1729098.1 hypothetical protein [Candidatus Margulisiibacteriota bacterium]MBU1954481.1 hypothetical protein [Candidatus Margulisiibacteriota bacterium]
MCFSAPASFGVGSVLVAASALTITKAAQKDRDYLLFAAVPLFFGLQQITEGFVWLNLGFGFPVMVKIFSFLFLFFAFFFWPFYSPLAVFMAEKEEVNRPVKRLLFVLTVIGFGVGVAAYAPLLIGAITLDTKVIGHSIAYATTRPNILKEIYIVFYLLAVVPPFLIGSDVKLKIFGFLLIGSILLAEFINKAAFDSVWCFFSAILSLFIVYIMLTLPKYVKPAK